MQPYFTNNDYRQQATELRDFLQTNTARKLHPEAPLMASWLTILLSTPSPDAIELLADEIKSVVSILERGLPQTLTASITEEVAP